MRREKMKHFKGFISGFLLASLLFMGSLTAFAATQSIQVSFDNIKINIDGKTILPKDANGNTVEPFIYNGTTYLPVRAVGDALGKTVSWDPATKTVYLSEKTLTENYTYYKDFKTVIDFGVFTGYKVDNSNIMKLDYGVAYFYTGNIKKEVIFDYCNALLKDGFVSNSTLSEIANNITNRNTEAFDKDNIGIGITVMDETRVLFLIMDKDKV
jgi:hypothetical protein